MHARDGCTPLECLDLLVILLRENDNCENSLSDDYYVAQVRVLIVLLASLVTVLPTLFSSKCGCDRGMCAVLRVYSISRQAPFALAVRDFEDFALRSTVFLELVLNHSESCSNGGIHLPMLSQWAIPARPDVPTYLADCVAKGTQLDSALRDVAVKRVRQNSRHMHQPRVPCCVICCNRLGPCVSGDCTLRAIRSLSQFPGISCAYLSRCRVL